MKPISTTAEFEQFLDVPARVYANDPNWVPPIRADVAKQFQPSNPFFEYGRLQQFVAYHDQQPVGRIVAAVNDRLIEREGKNIGLFGFFECVENLATEDPAVAMPSAIATQLFEAASQWLKEQGMNTIRGPIDLSTHNNCLWLVDGFDSPPYMMMPYNPPYYSKCVEKEGFHKAKDAYAYSFELSPSLLQKFEKAYQIALKSGITFRPVATKGEAFEQDCRDLYRLFTQAFSNNWSSTPRTEEEFLEEARDLKMIVDPDIFPIAEYEGEMVGFFMGLPNYNQVFKHLNGKLNWLGILKFLWYRRTINEARMIALCALPEHRRKMVAPALVYLVHRDGTGPSKRYEHAELSWIYEDNMPSRKITEASGGKIYKTYRIYEKAL
ncbi:MAG: GNAT family N-acetyltransferase [Cyanobacteria bacterium P01_A01_bin.17]